MLEVKIPAEIQEYKSKLIAGLSVRQFIAIAGALLVGVPIGVFGYGHIPDDILPWLIMISVVPFVGYGFFKFKGMNFEEFLQAWISFNFLPQKRVYEDTDVNYFYTIQEEMLYKDIVKQRIENGELSEDFELGETEEM